MAEDFFNNEEVPSRYQTLELEKIDQEYVGNLVVDGWRKSQQQRQEFLERREEWMATWRSLEAQVREGPWDNSANFHIPLTLTYGKAIHARLWQLFADRTAFFGVMSRIEAFKDREIAVKQFMDFVWTSWLNKKTGAKGVLDEWLWDVTFDGSGILKLWWHREKFKFLDSVPVKVTEQTTVFDRATLTGQTIEGATRIEHEDEEKEEVFECPMIGGISIEDLNLPIGQHDPQTSDWVSHQMEMTDEDLKNMVENEQFDKDAVEEIIAHRNTLFYSNDPGDQIKLDRRQTDGIDDYTGYTQEKCHYVIEWYGKAYISKEVDGEETADLEAMPQEIVAWVHKATKKVLGWTYLHRINPAGLRPIFKVDFNRFPGRTWGVGVGEMLDEISRNMDALYNLRVDNGTIASVPMGVFRASSGLKTDTINIHPGTLYPVDDVNDVRMFQFPYLAGFGEREEANLRQYAESLLSVSEIQLGIAPQKVGALRNATGSNILESASNIQLQIHFDRIARGIDPLLQALFSLCRQRMPVKLFYRVTGERGEPIFGEVSRQDLEGNFDFIINIDVLGQSKVERQQAATLKMQTLMNPLFFQTGIVQPSNLYNLAKEFLRANNTQRIDDYLTKPQDYQGEIISAGERFHRIAIGLIDGIEDTVRFNENHEQALKVYEAFKADDNYYGLLKPEQVAALERVIEKHMQLLEAQQAPGMLNNMGNNQLPQGALPPVTPQIGGGGETLQAQQTAQGLGTPNGPMV